MIIIIIIIITVIITTIIGLVHVLNPHGIHLYYKFLRINSCALLINLNNYSEDSDIIPVMYGLCWSV